jgi:hypothetical protein
MAPQLQKCDGGRSRVVQATGCEPVYASSILADRPLRVMGCEPVARQPVCKTGAQQSNAGSIPAAPMRITIGYVDRETGSSLAKFEHVPGHECRLPIA